MALRRVDGRVGDVSLVGVGVLVRWGVGGDEFGAGGEVEVGEDGESLGSVEEKRKKRSSKISIPERVR